MMYLIRRLRQIRQPRQGTRGFTLIEAAMTTAIISFGIVAMLELLATGTRANTDGAELTTAMNLAKSIREMSLGLHFADPATPTSWGAETGETLATYDDLDDLDGKSFSPPIDARRVSLSNYANWRQSIQVDTVDPDLLTSTVPKGSQPAIRYTVTISHHGRTVCSVRWIAFEAL